VVDLVGLVVLACVLRATAKKGRQLFVLPPSKYFPLEPPLERVMYVHINSLPPNHGADNLNRNRNRP